MPGYVDLGELVAANGRATVFVTGVLVFADADGLSYAAFAATIALLPVIGFLEARARAVLWAVTLIASALVADTLWLLDVEPFNRSDEYEAIGQTPFVMIGLPIPMAIIAVGVAAGALWRRLRRRLTPP